MAKDSEVEFDPKLAERIVKLRNDGAKWDEIVGQTDVPAGKALLLYEIAGCAPKDRVKNATAKDVVRLRESGLSWGKICGRTRIPESRLRSMFEEESKSSSRGNRIGKGGRYPSSEEVEPRAPRAAKAAKASANGGVKAAKRSDAAQALDSMEPDELKEYLTGRKVQISVGGGDTETVTIKAVKAVKNGSISVTDNDTKKARAFKVTAINQVSKNVVVKATVKAAAA